MATRFCLGLHPVLFNGLANALEKLVLPSGGHQIHALWIVSAKPMPSRVELDAVDVVS